VFNFRRTVIQRHTMSYITWIDYVILGCFLG